jgi:hypothetical protein
MSWERHGPQDVVESHEQKKALGQLREWIAAERELLTWRSGLETARRAWRATPDKSKGDALLIMVVAGILYAWWQQRGSEVGRLTWRPRLCWAASFPKCPDTFQRRMNLSRCVNWRAGSAAPGHF